MLIDVIFVIMIAYACIKGYSKGFIIAVFSFVGFFIGLAAALKLSAMVAGYLRDGMGMGNAYLPFLSFLLVFIIAVIVVNIIAHLIQKTMEMVMLGWLNRIAGILVYAFFSALLLSVLLFYGIQLHILSPETVNNSFSYPYLAPLGPKIIDSLGVTLPVFKNLFQQLQDFFGGFSG